MLWERPTRLSRTHGQRFALGGVAFELLAALPSTASFQLEPDVARYCVPTTSHPVVADVLCSVTVDDALFEHDSPFGGLELADGAFGELAHGELTVRAPRVSATLCRIGASRFACSARIASHPRALTTLLQSITTVIVHASGGVVVHAAGVALDGCAVAYVGTSGAGKSTAAELTNGARLFACDRLALIPQASGRVLAYGMPGGKAAEMPYTDRVVWPLAGVFRIMRDGPAVPRPHVPRLQIVRDGAALFLVRGAVESADNSQSAEQTRLATAAAIAGSICVGTLHTVLGVPIGALVREHLADAREAHA